MPDPTLIPVGTQIVTQCEVAGLSKAYVAGTAAQILEAPTDATHAYRVRLADGYETSLTRNQFVRLKTMQGEATGRSVPLLDHELQDAVIYKCIVGSRAYGLDVETSDTDWRGIYLAPAERHWSLFGVPDQIEHKANDEVYWELQRFLVLTLKANPNILEVLWSPLVEHVTPLAEQLLSLRGELLSKLVYQTYNGYVMSQFRKMQQRRKKGLEAKPKHAMHLIRLLLSGIEVLKTHRVPVAVAPEHRDALLSIRAGEMEFDAVDSWRKRLHSKFEDAFRESSLPERPDFEAANRFLLEARRFAAGESS